MQGFGRTGDKVGCPGSIADPFGPRHAWQAEQTEIPAGPLAALQIVYAFEAAIAQASDQCQRLPRMPELRPVVAPDFIELPGALQQVCEGCGGQHYQRLPRMMSAYRAAFRHGEDHSRRATRREQVGPYVSIPEDAATS